MKIEFRSSKHHEYMPIEATHLYYVLGKLTNPDKASLKIAKATEDEIKNINAVMAEFNLPKVNIKKTVNVFVESLE